MCTLVYIYIQKSEYTHRRMQIFFHKINLIDIFSDADIIYLKINRVIILEYDHIVRNRFENIVVINGNIEWHLSFVFSWQHVNRTIKIVMHERVLTEIHRFFFESIVLLFFSISFALCIKFAWFSNFFPRFQTEFRCFPSIDCYQFSWNS